MILDTNQLALMRKPIVFNRTKLHHITGCLGVNDVRVLQFNITTELPLIKQGVLFVNRTQSLMPSSCDNINKGF